MSPAGRLLGADVQTVSNREPGRPFERERTKAPCGALSQVSVGSHEVIAGLFLFDWFPTSLISASDFSLGGWGSVVLWLKLR